MSNAESVHPSEKVIADAKRKFKADLDTLVSLDITEQQVNFLLSRMGWYVLEGWFSGHDAGSAAGLKRRFEGVK